jgi:hypothetical protein
LSEVCPKCKQAFDSVERVTVGPRTFAKYTHKLGPPESIFVQTCYVRLETEEDSAKAKGISEEKEDYLDPED